MKLTFLGTSHGAPSDIRYCSSTMLEVNGSRYIIDAGAPVADILMRKNIPGNSVKAMFITHMHCDHTSGIFLFLCLASGYYPNCLVDIYMPDPNRVESFASVYPINRERVRMKTYEAGTFYKDENITVTAIPTRHIPGEPTYSFVIDTADGKRVIFTGDLHQNDAADFPQIAVDDPSDAIVCEQAHFEVETIFAYLRKCPTKRIFMNHVARNYEKSIALLREEEKNQTLPMPLRAVDDGDEYEI